VRPTLVAALALCVDKSLQSKTRHFLLGLSCDELEFIAEYLGCCILESARQCGCSRAQLAARIAEFQRARQGCSSLRSTDQEHKMILLLEYLCLTGVRQFSMPVRAGQAGSATG
jgi:hypothetical protein